MQFYPSTTILWSFNSRYGIWVSSLARSNPDPADLILTTGMFNYYQDIKSSRTMDSFLQMVSQWTKVLQDDERKELPVTELIVGDIVLLETGDRVPADIRILECQGKVRCEISITKQCMEYSRFLAEQEPFSLLDRHSRRFLYLFNILSKEKAIIRENI